MQNQKSLPNRRFNKISKKIKKTIYILSITMALTLEVYGWGLAPIKIEEFVELLEMSACEAKAYKWYKENYEGCNKQDFQALWDKIGNKDFNKIINKDFGCDGDGDNYYQCADYKIDKSNCGI